jgi:cytochrome c-type biogenesis protein CcmE
VSKGAQIAVGATLIALLLGWYGWTNLEAGATYQYYQTLDELLSAAPAERGDSLRVHGYVAEGSIQRDLAGKRVRFSVQNAPPHAGAEPGAILPVLYLGLETPDLFKDGAEVVVEGSLDGEGADAVFVAHNVLAKCPSKFEAQATRAAQL